MTETSLVASLAAAQLTMPPIIKGHRNEHFKSNYADIADVLAIVRPALAAQGIALVQPIETTENEAFLVTRLMKGSEVIESRMPLPMDVKAQELGSRLSYCRRYQLCALVGVAPSGEDDDGNAAQESGTTTSWQSGTRFPSGKLATEKQQKFAGKLMSDVVHVNLVAQYIEDHVGRAAALEELTTAEMSKLIDRLQDDKKAGRTPEGVYPEGQEPF
jgi:hypothetical protein